MSKYHTQRALAASLKTDSATIAKIATTLKIGSSGAHQNSAKTFTAPEADGISLYFYHQKEGVLRNQIVALEADILQQARTMSRLAGLAAACGGQCAEELRDLAEVVAKIDAGIGGKKPDFRNPEGKTRFLNAMNPSRVSLRQAIAAVRAKI